MSLNAVPLHVVPAIDEVLNIQSERFFSVYDGGTESSYIPFYSQNVNNGTISINCNPPDEKTIIDPQMYVKVDYDAVFTGTSVGGSNLLQPGVYDAPRAFPIASTTTTLDAKLNGTSINTQLNEYFHAIMRTGDYLRNFDLDFSTTTSQLDQYQDYGQWQQYGQARNPMALYGENATQQTRGALLNPVTGAFNLAYNSTTGPNNYYKVNTPTAAEVVFSSVEPIFLSPFYHNKSGFSAKTLQLTWTFSDLKRIWSHAPQNLAAVPPVNSSVLTSVNVNITGLTVFIRFITPKDLMKIPATVTYPYHEILVLPSTNLTSLAPNQTASISMNAVNLQAVPKRLLIQVRRRDQEYLTGALNYQYSDTSAVITNITLNWANNQGKLSSATIYDLYTISRRNNCNLSFDQWSNFVGSVLPIDIGKNVGLNQLDSAGKLSNPQLSMTVQYVNTHPTDTIFFSLMVYVIYEGTFCIHNGSVTKNISVLNSQDVLDASLMHNPIIADDVHQNMYGGSILSSIKDALSRAHKFVKKHRLVSRIASQIPHPIARKVAKNARMLGYGAGVVDYPKYYFNEEVDGGKKRKKKKKSATKCAKKTKSGGKKKKRSSM